MSVSNEETPMQSEQPYEFSRDELRAIEHHRKLELGEQDEVFGTVFSQSAHFSYFPLAKVQGVEWVRRNAWGEIAIDAGRISAGDSDGRRAHSGETKRPRLPPRKKFRKSRPSGVR